MMTRRNTLLRLGAIPVLSSAAGIFAGLRGLLATAPAHAARTYEVVHTDAEWQKLLQPKQYRVLRKAGTEAPFSSPLDKEKRAGVYNCAGCALPLFSSATKFESGTGWPSFTTPVADGVVGYHLDESHGMQRIEALCNVCDGHLGHVFPDGPEPSGLRFCMNALALEKIAD